MLSNYNSILFTTPPIFLLAFKTRFLPDFTNKTTLIKIGIEKMKEKSAKRQKEVANLKFKIKI